MLSGGISARAARLNGTSSMAIPGGPAWGFACEKQTNPPLNSKLRNVSRCVGSPTHHQSHTACRKSPTARSGAKLRNPSQGFPGAWKIAAQH